MTDLTKPSSKRYALYLVRLFSEQTQENREYFLDAVAYATEHASTTEIAEAAGWSRQGILKLVKRQHLGNGVDKTDERV